MSKYFFYPLQPVKSQFSNSGYLMALLATIIWSGNFIVARDLNQTYTPITISFFRWLVATVVILPFALHYIKKDFSLLIRQWRLLAVISFLGITVFNTLIYLAAHFTTVLNLSLLAITAPLYVVALNRIIYKEHITKTQAAGFLILIFGLLLLLSKGQLGTLLQLTFNKGDLLMGGAAALFAIYTVLIKKKNPAIGNLSFVSVTFLLGLLMLFPFFAVERLLHPTPMAFTGRSVFQLLYFGVGPSVISYYLWNKSIALIGSTPAATIYNTLPVYSALLAALFLGEKVLWIQVIRSILILSGVLIVIQRGGSSEYRSPLVAKD